MNHGPEPAKHALTGRSLNPWLLVVMLFPVALLNYLDRQIFATMKKSMMGEIPSIGTEQQFGALMGIFLIVYGCCSPVGGYLADRFNRRWTVTVSLAVWSAVTWLTGHCHDYTQLWWARAAMGISEACYIPAALALIADYHSGPTRSRAVGVHQSGIYAGLALGGLGGYVADSAYGWRSAFTWLGMAGVLYSIVLLVFLRDAPRPASTTGTASTRLNPWSSVKELVCIGSFILLVLYFTFPALPGWLVKNWMPAILADTFHLGQGKAGISATLWVTMASFVGVLAGGALADRWMRGTERGRIYTSAVGVALCIPALFGVGLAPTLTVAIMCLVLFGIGWGFFDANNMPILCQIARPELRATGYGLMNMVSITAGGWFTRQVGGLRDQGVSPFLIFCFCAIAAAISVALVLLIRPRVDCPSPQPKPALSLNSRK
jgi:MFS transporter, Spinster family, sphingosine-1-phosphate transporter